MSLSTRPRETPCGQCRKPVLFVRMEATGKPMPVDPKPSDDGTVAAIRDVHGTLVGWVMKAGEQPLPGYRRYVTHFATCPRTHAQPKSAKVRDLPKRRPRRRPAAGEAEVIPLFGSSRGR